MLSWDSAFLPRVRELTDFIDCYHSARNHQGKGRVLLFPAPRTRPTKAQEPIRLS
jgi:hypothetical protein